MKHLETIDEIQGYFARLVNGEEPNSKMTLARIYGAAERHAQDEQRTNFVDEALESDKFAYVCEKTFICERLTIAKVQTKVAAKTNIYYLAFVDQNKRNLIYDDFISALIGGICMMYKPEDAALYVMRMLGTDKDGD